MRTPVVSLITPAFNQAEFLARTIDSVLAQDWPAIDYRVIDDGSTDHTPDVLAGYAGRVRHDRQPNAGQARTLNRGWGEAEGEYLAYLSSDDVLYPRAVSAAVAVLEADAATVCVFPDADLIDEDDRVLKRRVFRPFDLAELVVMQECWIGPGAVFRASAYRETGGWKPELRLAPDREFWMRLSALGRFHFLDESLAGYRLHMRSMSYREVSEAQSREYLDVLDGYFAGATVRPEIRAREIEAYAQANLLIARNCARSGQFGRARSYFRRAIELHPPLDSFATRLMLARTVAGKPLRLVQSKLRAALA